MNFCFGRGSIPRRVWWAGASPPRFWLVRLAGIALTPLGARHSP